ncbi:MAG: hypothetical protein JO354_06210 [Verrucomicrobia bacterium]|nr:hypothetical protein [Verrucomicrobiota bacterium]
MNPYDIVHLTLHAFGGHIEGRTKLQKTLYFVGVFTDSVRDLGYRPHFYGPYSDLVTAAVARLKSLGFVTETTLGSGAIGEGGFEIARHDFHLTDEGKRIAQEKATRNPEAWSKLKDAVDRVKEAGQIDYMRMSVAAKTYHMLSLKGKEATPQELSESARSLGWEAKPHDIEQSVSYLQKLGLVTVTA